MMGSLDHTARKLTVTTSPIKVSADFIDLLEELDRLYGPQPGKEMTPTVTTLDNGPVHTSKVSRKALDDRKHWLTVEWLPKYTPKLNDIETAWRDLKAHHLANQTFTDAADFDQAVAAFNVERGHLPLGQPKISAESNIWNPRFLAAIMSFGSVRQTNGFTSVRLCSLIKRLMVACKSTTDRKTHI